MGIDRRMYLTSHAHKDNNLTGTLLRISFSNLQMELGLPANVFDHDYQQWKYLATRSWASETWHFASEHNIGVDAKIPELPLKREFDGFLMLQFFTQGFRKGQLEKALQRVCQFLQVNTISDITSMDGTMVRDRIFDGRGTPENVHTWQAWPIQTRPAEQDWYEWRRAIYTLTETHRPRRLQHPLGAWIAVPDEEWVWYLEVTSCRLYIDNSVRTGLFTCMRGR